MSDFADLLAGGYIGSRENREQERRQIAENRSRQAFNSYAVVTTGVGDIVPAQPLMFGARYVEEPFLTTGLVLVRQPDLTRYRYPLVTAGVLRWVTEPLRPPTLGRAAPTPAPADLLNTPDSLNPVAYVGAYMYFVVDVEPLRRPRTDGSNLASLQALLAGAVVGSADAVKLTQQVKEAVAAVDLLTHLPDAVIRHHLTFRGMAMKSLLQDAVEELARSRGDLDVRAGLS